MPLRRQKETSPSITVSIDIGRTKVAVPTCTAAAPASMYSTASAAVAMPPQPITGMRDGLGALVGHAHDDRLDRRPRQPAHDVAEPRLERLDVDRHGQDGVGDDQRVGAGALGRARDGGDVAGVGRELDPQGQPRRARGSSPPPAPVERAYMAKALPSSSMFGQEMLASIARDAGHIEPGDRGGEGVARRRRHADHQRRAELAIERQRLVEEIVDALARNADRVEHALPDLAHARGRIAAAQFRRDRLGDERAEAIEGEDLRQSLGEGAGSRHHRILQDEVADATRCHDLTMAAPRRD